MSGPAFGFSAGDFIAGVNLIAKVTQALKEAGGASDEYRSLGRELGLLERILRQLHAGQGIGGVPSPDIRQQTDLTLDTLSSFLKTISKFDAKLGQQAPSTWHHGVARKTQWAVVQAKEVEKVRVKLGTQLTELNLLLQLQTSINIKSVTTTLADISPAIQAQNRQLLAWHQQTSTGIDGLSSKVDDLSTFQKAVLNRQHSVVLAQFRAARNDIQPASGQTATIRGSVASQPHQRTILRLDIQNSHRRISSRVQGTCQLSQQGMDALSKKADLILHAISNSRLGNNTGEGQLMRLDGQDEVLVLLFQLLRALTRSMGDLLTKTGLLLPYIFASVVTLTTTIRREPMLLVEDSINFTDAIGRKYTLQYEYFKYWCNFEAFVRRQFRDVPGEEYISSTSYRVPTGPTPPHYGRRKGYQNRLLDVAPGQEIGMGFLTVDLSPEYHPSPSEIQVLMARGLKSCIRFSGAARSVGPFSMTIVYHWTAGGAHEAVHGDHTWYITTAGGAWA